jgi:hypothetical protein
VSKGWSASCSPQPLPDRRAPGASRSVCATVMTARPHTRRHCPDAADRPDLFGEDERDDADHDRSSASGPRRQRPSRGACSRRASRPARPRTPAPRSRRSGHLGRTGPGSTTQRPTGPGSAARCRTRRPAPRRAKLGPSGRGCCRRPRTSTGDGRGGAPPAGPSRAAGRDRRGSARCVRRAIRLRSGAVSARTACWSPATGGRRVSWLANPPVISTAPRAKEARSTTELVST